MSSRRSSSSSSSNKGDKKRRTRRRRRDDDDEEYVPPPCDEGFTPLVRVKKERVSSSSSFDHALEYAQQEEAHGVDFAHLCASMVRGGINQAKPLDYALQYQGSFMNEEQMASMYLTSALPQNHAATEGADCMPPANVETMMESHGQLHGESERISEVCKAADMTRAFDNDARNVHFKQLSSHIQDPDKRQEFEQLFRVIAALSSGVEDFFLMAFASNARVDKAKNSLLFGDMPDKESVIYFAISERKERCQKFIDSIGKDATERLKRHIKKAQDDSEYYSEQYSKAQTDLSTELERVEKLRGSLSESTENANTLSHKIEVCNKSIAEVNSRAATVNKKESAALNKLRQEKQSYQRTMKQIKCAIRTDNNHIAIGEREIEEKSMLREQWRQRMKANQFLINFLRCQHLIFPVFKIYARRIFAAYEEVQARAQRELERIKEHETEVYEQSGMDDRAWSNALEEWYMQQLLDNPQERPSFLSVAMDLNPEICDQLRHLISFIAVSYMIAPRVRAIWSKHTFNGRKNMTHLEDEIYFWLKVPLKTKLEAPVAIREWLKTPGYAEASASSGCNVSPFYLFPGEVYDLAFMFENRMKRYTENLTCVRRLPANYESGPREMSFKSILFFYTIHASSRVVDLENEEDGDMWLVPENNAAWAVSIKKRNSSNVSKLNRMTEFGEGILACTEEYKEAAAENAGNNRGVGRKRKKAPTGASVVKSLVHNKELSCTKSASSSVLGKRRRNTRSSTTTATKPRASENDKRRLRSSKRRKTGVEEGQEVVPVEEAEEEEEEEEVTREEEEEEDDGEDESMDVAVVDDATREAEDAARNQTPLIYDRKFMENMTQHDLSKILSMLSTDVSPRITGLERMLVALAERVDMLQSSMNKMLEKKQAHKRKDDNNRRGSGSDNNESDSSSDEEDDTNEDDDDDGHKLQRADSAVAAVQGATMQQPLPPMGNNGPMMMIPVHTPSGQPQQFAIASPAPGMFAPSQWACTPGATHMMQQALAPGSIPHAPGTFEYGNALNLAPGLWTFINNLGMDEFNAPEGVVVDEQQQQQQHQSTDTSMPMDTACNGASDVQPLVRVKREPGTYEADEEHDSFQSMGGSSNNTKKKKRAQRRR